MSFEPKVWKDLPDVTTPLSANALMDMETRLAAYTDEKYFDATNYTAGRETFILNEAAEWDEAKLVEANSYSDMAADAALASASDIVTNALARWQAILERRAAFNSGSALSATHAMTGNGTHMQLPATASAYSFSGVFHYDPADHLVSGYTHRLRLKTAIIASETALNVNLTFGIAPVTAFNSAASSFGMTLGSNVVGATVTHGSGLSAETASVQSIEFDGALLTAGFYAITVIAAGTINGTTPGWAITNLDERHLPS